MNREELKKLLRDHNIQFEDLSLHRLTPQAIISTHKIVHDDKELQAAILKLKRASSTESDSMQAVRRIYSQVLAHISKSHKILAQNYLNKLGVARKISTLCLREFRRGMLKTGRTNIFLKGRKVGKEVLLALKKTDRNEDSRKRRVEVERKKEEIERKKREFEEMEAERQARKLDFLINQTELYSHFVLNKRRYLLENDLRLGRDEDVVKRAKVFNENGSEENANGPDISYSKAREKALEAANKQMEYTEAYDKCDSTNTAQKERILECGNARTEERREVSTQAEIQDSGTSDTNCIQNMTNRSTATDTHDASFRILQPSILKAQLKEYQLKGLNWLVNLYNQGINGILADDMGLGKTVQSISFLAYLFETKGLHGPFLIVTPTSTLPNWASELERFVPSISVIKYYGNIKERRKLKFNSGNIVLTSYSIFILDEKCFMKQKWQYMVLDEAQAIKSNKSLRWNKLLKIKTRNRLLLTGTPIQNNLKELWSLLHFIMPTLFDNLLEFEDWFMKMNEDKLDRLHMILKPFMLRREKKDVASELKEKKIKVIYCSLSYRQKKQYEILERKCPIDFRDREVANVLMHYRKVCNHPDLFQKNDVETGFSFHMRDNGRKNIGFRSSVCIKMPMGIWIQADKSRYSVNPFVNISGIPTDAATWKLNSMCGQGIHSEREDAESCQIELDYEEVLASIKLEKVDLEHIKRSAESVIPTLCYKNVIDDVPRIITEYDDGSCLLRISPVNNLSMVKVPASFNLVKDSGKLETLDLLLAKLFKERHRPLIYFQMTKMMDLMEDYLKMRKYKYLRLDGSTKVSDRRELVERWQQEDIFIFLLSTRAGGLGINLTAADTVIFYDNDWNPTVDRQAMDRAHRLGQLRDVTVYKLVCLGTVEEKIMELAEKKDEIQKMVIEKGDFIGADI